MGTFCQEQARKYILALLLNVIFQIHFVLSDNITNSYLAWSPLVLPKKQNWMTLFNIKSIRFYGQVKKAWHTLQCSALFAAICFSNFNAVLLEALRLKTKIKIKNSGISLQKFTIKVLLLITVKVQQVLEKNCDIGYLQDCLLLSAPQFCPALPMERTLDKIDSSVG